MKTMKFLTYATFVLFLGIAISSCKGEDGVDGQDGAPGAQGPAGQDGADGADGNANVIYSDWIAPAWAEGTLYGVAIQEYFFNVPELTQDMVDHSAVLLYWKNWNEDIWQLPLGVLDNDLELDYTYSLNTIHLYMYDGSNTAVAPAAYSSSNLFKYIIIEGSVAAGSKTVNSSKESVYNELTAAGVDVNNYEEVCAYYGINPK